MPNLRAKHVVETLLSQADVVIGGNRTWDIIVNDDRFYRRVLANPSLGLGESYMDGWWECEQIDEMLTRVLRARLDESVKRSKLLLPTLLTKVTNIQRKSKAFEIGERHYDVGNDLFEKMLDKRMAYSCGYWKNAKTLDEAQVAKLDLMCRKLGLKRGDHVLDIGCGWGSFMIYAAEKYGVRCTGITVSKEQVALGRKRVQGLPVEFLLKDYRDIQGSYNHIVSVGMFEHVGYKNYKTFFSVARRVLKDQGLFLLHTIGMNKAQPHEDPFFAKYIFPNSMSPSIGQLATALEGLFVMEDWHNFSAYYDTTLQHWYQNFEAAWPQLKSKYSERFYRMWRYYLMAAMANFRSRHGQLWQVVLSKSGVPGGYERIS